jgi:ComF family protein
LGSERLEQRGYNQVDLFGRPLADRLGLPYDRKALRRVKQTRSQVGLTPEQRVRNLRSAFRAEEARVAGKHVLLLDDVFTSGSTGSACARALYGAGAETVRVFTLARANQGENR